MQRSESEALEICYLCGQEIQAGQEAGRDHVPALKIFPVSLRRNLSPNLITLPAHRSCNLAYSMDEEYFLHSVGPTAVETLAGAALFRDTIEPALKRPGYGERMGQKILGEFVQEVGGIVLPPSVVGKTFDPERVYRVLWKIIRGLFFKERGVVLPERQWVGYKLYNEKAPPPPELIQVLIGGPPRLVEHSTIFTYWSSTKEVKGTEMHLWALLFWDAILFAAAFHDPACSCDRCNSVRERR